MSDSDSDASDSPSKRRRSGGNFGNHGSAEPSADLELELMLAAQKQGSRPSGGVGILSEAQQMKLQQQYSGAQKMAGSGGAGGFGGGPVDLGGFGGQLPMHLLGGLGSAGLGPGGKGGDSGAPINPEPVIATTPMDFSKLSRDQTQTTVDVQKDLIATLMTPEHRQILVEESGAGIEWSPDNGKVLISGSPEQTARAQRLLARACMHSRWGVSSTKVRQCLKPTKVESVKIRMSPMAALKTGQKTLGGAKNTLSIGKDKKNDLVVNDALISRSHCVLQLDEERGSVYVIDCSSNGTFLNGMRLPGKDSGKVMISHGDELLFKDPASGDAEFGYIVNITILSVVEELKLVAPRRLLTAGEMSFGPQ